MGTIPLDFCSGLVVAVHSGTPGGSNDPITISGKYLVDISGYTAYPVRMALGLVGWIGNGNFINCQSQPVSFESITAG